jgi:hypothetical protein
MPWHVATLKGRNKCRGEEGARGRKRRVINKEKKRKDERMRSSRIRMTNPQNDGTGG